MAFIEPRLQASIARDTSRTFYDTHVRDSHRALREPLTYDTQRAQLSTKGITDRQRLDTVTADFNEALALYQQDLNGLRSSHGTFFFKIDNSHLQSFEDVMLSARFAEEEYNKATQGVAGAPRALFRLLGDRNDLVVPWLDLLPSTTYTSPVCGALKIIFGAAAFRSDKRKRILQAFKELPATINSAQDRRTTFADDKVLHDLSIELYITILTTTRLMIIWLVGKDKLSGKDKLFSKDKLDKIKSLFGGSKLDELVETELTNIEEWITAIKTRVEQLRDRLFVNIGTGVQALTPKLDVLDGRTKSLEGHVTSIDITARGLNTGLSGINTGLSGITKSMEARYCIDDERHLVNRSTLIDLASKMEKMEQAAEAQNRWIELLTSSALQAQWAAAVPQTFIREKHANAMISHQALITLLGVDSNFPGCDVKAVDARAYQFEESQQSSVLTVLKSWHFQSWLNTDRPKLLFINGNRYEQVTASTSSLSILCGILTKGLGNISSAQVVYHFCGLHTRSDDDVAGPQGIARSLVTQILRLFDFDLDFVNHNLQNDILHRSLQSLCNLLGRLLLDLPSGLVLFCVIDGIAVYESQRWIDDMAYLLSFLNNLICNQPIRATVKVLIVHPGSSRLVRQIVSKDDIYTVPRDAGGHGGLLTPGHVNLGMRRSFDTTRSRTPEYSSAPAYSQGYYEDRNVQEVLIDFDEGNE